MQNRINHHSEQEHSVKGLGEKENSIELRSPEIQELLGVPPRWIIRRGITILLLVVIVLISGSFVFRYPERIYAPIILFSENQPVQVTTGSDGRIEALFVTENQQVKTGEIIGVIESNVNFEDALHLMAKIDSFAYFTESHKTIPQKFFRKNYVLGNMQSRFTSFLTALHSLESAREKTAASSAASALQEKLEMLNSELRAWEQAFVLKAPVSGQIYFGGRQIANQYVTSGDILFTVIPDETGKISGRIEIPAAGIGKIEPGQRVNIKVENYPFMEYGVLSGSVSAVSKIPVTDEQGAFYSVNVDLPDGLVTGYKRKLSYSVKMRGDAEIIIRNRRLIELLIEPLTSLSD